MVKVSKKGVVVLAPDNICVNITNDMFKTQGFDWKLFDVIYVVQVFDYLTNPKHFIASI